jgi:predicted transcriptional regulator
MVDILKVIGALLHESQSTRWERKIMTDDNSTQKVDLSRVAEIVSSYVAKNSIGVDQIGGLIATVHRALSGLGESGSAPVSGPLAPAVPIRRSVQPDYVVCLDCGFRGITLRRHLRVQHGLEVADYRARWRLSPDHAVTAPAYSARRSTMAKEIGLGRQPAAVETPPAPTRRGRPRRSPAP